MKRQRWFMTFVVALAASLGAAGYSYAAPPSLSSVKQAAQGAAGTVQQGAANAAADIGNAAAGGAQNVGQTFNNAAGSAAGAVVDIANMVSEQAVRAANCGKALPDCAVDVYNDVKNSLPNVTPADIQAAMTKVAVLGGTVTDNTGKPLPGVSVQVNGGTVQGDVSDACKAVLAVAARGTVASAQYNFGSIKAGFVIDNLNAAVLTAPDGAYRIPVPACASIQYTVAPLGGVASFFSWAPGNREVTVASGGAGAGQAPASTGPKTTRSASSPSRPVKAGSAQPANSPVQKAPVLGGQTLTPLK